jgi:FkbM family methyltransferase
MKFEEIFKSQVQAGKKVDNFDLFQKVQRTFNNTPPQNLLFSKYKLKAGYFLKQLGNRKFTDVDKYFTELGSVYDKLETEESKELFVKLLVFRKLGYTKVSLPLCNDEYIKGIEKIRKLADCTETIDPGFLAWKLCKFDLRSIGYDITLFFEPASVYIEFVLNPYRYNKNGITIKCEENDIVIDAGGCWGDTALNFASEAGENGKVYSFEFIRGNLDIMKKNFALNNELQKRIEIVEHPVWDRSDIKMYCNDFGPASTIQPAYSEHHNIEVSTITIDDLVLRRNIQKIDFIKMDIEGAETFALKGAIETIRKFKPKLAISVYHSLSDFFEIPKLIDDLNLGYKFYLGHFTHMAGETVLYAKVG